MLRAFIVALAMIAPTLLAVAGVGQGTPQLNDLPDPACSWEDDEFILCTWRADFSPSNPAFEADLSWMPRALVEIEIGALDVAGGAPIFAWELHDAAEPFQYGFGYGQGVASAVAFLDVEPGHQTVFWFDSASLGPPTGGTPAAIPGSFEVRAAFFLTAGVITATEPAGTREDPQIRDALDDVPSTNPVAPTSYADIAGAWFDDAVLDDDLFEVGLIVPNLDLAVPSVGDRRGEYNLEWSVHGERYGMRWTWFDPQGPTSLVFTNVRQGWDGSLERRSADGGIVTAFGARPLVDLENGTLEARIPIRFIGSPGDGIEFQDVIAWSGTDEFRGINNGQGSVLPHVLAPPNMVDTATDMDRPFALGGPEVWAAFRGQEIEPESNPSWIEAPFSSDNLPDTIQVVGAVLAATTFLFGFYLVRRRRQHLARLLDDVDAVLDVHRDDPKAALKALDRLDEHFDALFKRGKISENQHTVLETRIERAGYRLLRRRDA